jgi:hypothetical protein
VAELRQANAHHVADYKRRLAEIERRLKALEDRAFVDEILSVTLGETEGESGIVARSSDDNGSVPRSADT